jgi:hypothetical protein
MIEKYTIEEIAGAEQKRRWKKEQQRDQQKVHTTRPAGGITTN